MSVEEAWYTVEARIRAEAGADSIREARERLFREVRAEIACEEVGGDWIWDCTGSFSGNTSEMSAQPRDRWCITCLARQQLAEAKPV